MIRQSLAIVVVLLSTASAGLYEGMTPYNHTCTLDTPLLSCSPSANESLVDSCCVETFGGLVMLTQYWKTYTGLEDEGQLLPQDSWTIHGLWPDFCNGSYTQYCDLNRQYDPAPYPNTTTGTPDGTPVPVYNRSTIDTFLEPFGRLDLLDYMNRYWIAQNEPNPTLWAHEFSKHATCFSNFDIECYGLKYQEHEDVIEYFEATVQFFMRLPTWSWLAAGGIRPSNETAYSLNDFNKALTNGFGAVPGVRCSGPAYNETDAGAGSDDNGKTVISEMWYYHHIFGRVQRGQALPVDANINGGSTSNCAKAPGALWYYERSPNSVN